MSSEVEKGEEGEYWTTVVAGLPAGVFVGASRIFLVTKLPNIISNNSV